MSDHDVLVVGAGAAGLMCALTAGQRGRRVLVLESANRAGKKILMSGGGRCNFTNLNIDPARYRSANPHFCKSALARYTQWDFIELVERHGIPYHEKSAAGGQTGQLFCDRGARDILQMLLAECAEAGVELRTRDPVLTVTPHAGGYRVRSASGTWTCAHLVVASGGLSVPTLGGTRLGYELGRQFGHDSVPVRPGLVPMTFTEPWLPVFSELAGLAFDAVVGTTHGSAHAGPVLMTHRGLSGPAILRASNDWREGETITLDLLPGLGGGALREAKRTGSRLRLRQWLQARWPRSLATAMQARWWPERAALALGQWPDAALDALEARLRHWQLQPSGTEGYRTAEVTLGGIDTAQVSSRTFESRLQPGLFLIGEVLDVTGDLGGFNFQWAWSSGRAAGLVA